MKDVFENVMKDLDDFPSNNFTTFKPFEKILNEIEVSNLSIADLKQSDFKGEWMYVNKLLELHTAMIYGVYPDGLIGYDWSTNRIGSFLVKGLNILIGYGCIEKTTNLLDKTFTFPEGCCSLVLNYGLQGID